MLSTPPAFILSQDQTLKLKFGFFLARNLLAFYPFTDKGFCSWHLWCPWNSFEFSRLFHCLIVNVLFIFFASRSVSHSISSFSISCSFSFVNNFFYFFYFKFQKTQYIKRRRRDLNPRAAINDLLPFQGSPFSLLGTSPCRHTTFSNYYQKHKQSKQITRLLIQGNISCPSYKTLCIPCDFKAKIKPP